MAKLHNISFPGDLLKRGFWLYVWEITADDKRVYHYVGMTGDMSSLHAQSPMSRISGHLGSNKHANALRRHLQKSGVSIESCEELKFFSYGPIYEETKDKASHINRRDKVRGLEKALCDAMHGAGYRVVNHINCRVAIDSEKWKEVHAIFSKHFSLLAKCM